jgi:hypothetical protein
MANYLPKKPPAISHPCLFFWKTLKNKVRLYYKTTVYLSYAEIKLCRGPIPSLVPQK